MQTTSIGLAKEYTTNVEQEMNLLLASFTVYYQNLRALHWNISGAHFFQLHEKFELLYTRAAVEVDDIAERILILEATPLHTLEDFINNSEISSSKNVTDDQSAVKVIIENLSKLLLTERKILELANENMDDGTADLMTRLINDQEKDHWMMRAWLGKKV
ncbi:MAG: DNA starvation/stationary phase protection protein [Calditrichaeota bacterium]|nr:MAG: DNA starvation/stationary phase protection protein [Calditrichota bacterium]MBL1205114.1 DNA starvation/stationary phase protection protein [Calditrichota bacterium]NOG44944.1 DNA starvation/stationary phase protection protein [Calditrichota bacterium]